MYAGPRTYEKSHKDLFSVGRLALELFLEQKGISQHSENLSRKMFCLTQSKDWLYLAFFPQEDSNELKRPMGHLTSFLETVTRALSVELELASSSRYIRYKIIDDIIKNIPAGNSTSTSITSPQSTQTMDSLLYEADNLLNFR